jgi:hypothetical protein
MFTVHFSIKPVQRIASGRQAAVNDMAVSVHEQGSFCRTH